VNDRLCHRWLSWGGITNVSGSTRFTCVQSKNLTASRFNILAFGKPRYTLNCGVSTLTTNRGGEHIPQRILQRKPFVRADSHTHGFLAQASRTGSRDFVPSDTSPRVQYSYSSPSPSQSFSLPSLSVSSIRSLGHYVSARTSL